MNKYTKNGKLVAFFLVIFVCAGCTGSKNIQDLAYIVTIGLDYDDENDEYTVYLQGLNFANVAKQEGSKSQEPIPTLIGKAKGKTMNLAISKLFRLSRPPLFFGHTKTIVISKNILTYKFKEVLEDVGRNYSLRPSLEILVTDEDMEEVLSAKGLFDYPPVYTVLLTSEKLEKIKNDIEPTNLMHFLREYYEPMGSAFLPTVKLDHDAWQASEKITSLYLDGYSVFQGEELKGDLPAKDAMMVYWLRNKNSAIYFPLYQDGELMSTFDLSVNKMKVKYLKSKTEFSAFSLEVDVEAEMLEKIADIPYGEMKKALQQAIEKEITSVYQNGLTKEMDLLDVGETWFRKHPQAFRELEKKENKFYLTESSLNQTMVKVDIKHFNAYRYKKEDR
ncbi:Ger(x)C family spore germination protein [Bacillus sp. KH172YL63]|uniref:Ger(x)C family spore germination protein n=1 Tax=Bacillus sp. KH172YL63 TaxID=2709784 RepID=UPI0013E41211|nr:Ger(x)C family spore germination protein [Bacillus sp. KH172YL63]BCB03542.1 hypothetical protein KH172YL63_16750 [Bacillus sp. KH172YL63]